MRYRIVLTPAAKQMLGKIPDRRIRKTVAERINELDTEPEKQGKPLVGNLADYRSVHAAGRYRIIFQVNLGQITVLVVGVGIRKEGDKRDIYRLMRRFINLGLVEQPP